MLYVQYANSTNFQNLLYGGSYTAINDAGVSVKVPYAGLNNYMNCYWMSFYKQIFDIKTAHSLNYDGTDILYSAGLDLWGEILGVGRQFIIGTQDSTFGFDQNPHNLTGYAQNFDHGTFTQGGTYSILPDAEYRALLMLVARTMISNLSILSITKLLNDFFTFLTGAGSAPKTQYEILANVSVDATNPMQINYEFRSAITPASLAKLPIWIANIFNIANQTTGTFYLPLPIGRTPHIIST